MDIPCPTFTPFATITAVERLMQLKTSFLAQLPSLLYVHDQDHYPGHLQFKQARAVRIRKEYWLQLRTDDFRELARCAPSVHHASDDAYDKQPS